METKEKERTKKMLLALPVLVLPFLALAFYALGGGRGTVTDDALNANQGINTSLPDASFRKEDPQDKLSLYEQVGRKRQDTDTLPASVTERGFTLSGQPDPQEQAIEERLAQITAELNRPEPPVATTPTVQVASSPDISGDVDRLEKLMRTMQEYKEEDPEMAQLTGMLDKILAIQNPDLMQLPEPRRDTVPIDSLFRAIPAEIVKKQKAVQGASITLRLLDTVTLNGYLIPKGHEITGSCRITNQRLLLAIKNIRLGTSIIPVDLTVYSPDGMMGINAPEAELADAAGMGADNAARSIGLYGIDQSIATQVAGAGIDAAKTLFSKRIRKIKVKLDAGTPVLLRNNQSKNR